MEENRSEHILYSTETERLVLGLCFLDNSIIKRLSKDLFFWNEHGSIFEAMKNVYENRGSFDLFAITDKLRFDITARTGLKELKEMPEAMGIDLGNEDSISHHIDSLKHYKTVRNLKTDADNISKNIMAANHDNLDEAIDEMRKKVLEGKDGEQVYDIEGLFNGWRAFKDSGGGTSIGIPTFDGMSRGIAPGEVMYFMARAKVIKSILTQNILRHFTDRNPEKGAVFFSLEMSSPQLVERLVKIEAGHRIEHATDDEILQIKERHKNVIYVTRPAMSLLDIYGEVVKAKHRLDVRLVVIDFLTRIRTDIAGEYDFLRKATKFIKDMAKEQGIAIIVLTQVGREAGRDGDVPLSMRAGRGSGTIEEDADFILGAYRPELNKFLSPSDSAKVQGIVCVQILGARRLPVMEDVFLDFCPDTLRLTELPGSWDGKLSFYSVVGRIRNQHKKDKKDEKST